MIAIFCVVGLVVRLIATVAVGLLGTLFHERRARRTFRRALRRGGLTEAEADALAADYQAGIGIRDLVRGARVRTT